MTPNDLLILAAAIVAAVSLVLVVRARHRSHAVEQNRLAEKMVCEHLRSTWQLLESRGHHATRVGQHGPDLPLEIHTAPPFDPQAVYDELKLAEPVYVSERNVLYCRQDWCEIHPTA